MATKTETLAQHVERCYRTEDWDSLTEIYAPEVLLDVNVPSWRFQIQGHDVPVGWFKEQIARFENFRVTWVRATPTEDGVVVEWEMHTKRRRQRAALPPGRHPPWRRRAHPHPRRLVHRHVGPGNDRAAANRSTYGALVTGARRGGVWFPTVRGVQKVLPGPMIWVCERFRQESTHLK